MFPLLDWMKTLVSAVLDSAAIFIVLFFFSWDVAIRFISASLVGFPDTVICTEEDDSVVVSTTFQEQSNAVLF